MKATPPNNQPQRLQALRGFGILDTPREPAFDEIASFASALCSTPISVINLIDEERQWFKAEVGLGVRETPLDASLCAHAILEQDLLVVPDLLDDDRFCDNPLCIGDPRLRFYAGAILRTEDGYPLGTLCVLDHTPRRLSSLQIEGLRVLARQVMTQMELRRSLARADVLVAEIDHRVKNSLTLVSGLLSAQSRASDSDIVKEQLSIARDRVLAVAEVHDQLQLTASGATVRFEPFLRSLVSRLSLTAPTNVNLTFVADDIEVTTQQASSVGVLVNELVTNAFRHAFRGEAGEVRVDVQLLEGTVALVVSDNGIGMSTGNAPIKKGIGTRIMKAIATQLGGDLQSVSTVRGTSTRIEFRPGSAVPN